MKLYYSSGREADAFPSMASIGTMINNGSRILKSIRHTYFRFKSNPTPENLSMLNAELKAASGIRSLMQAPAAGGVNQLRAIADSVADYDDYLWGRKLMMSKVELKLSSLKWKDKSVWAEAYASGHWNQKRYGPLEPYILDLERECDVTSNWAMKPPRLATDWFAIGRREAESLSLWPQLPNESKYKVSLLGRLGIQANEWPRWAANPGFARKGMFCHSSAAIAAYMVHQYKNQLAQRGCVVRSIDLIHQKPKQGLGDMSHWWVCINRPESIEIDGTTVQMNTFGNIKKYLAISGGFVIDIWGALYKSLNGELHTSTKNIPVRECVWSAPNSGFLGETRVEIFARWQNTDANAYVLRRCIHR